jgi:hypothetical protein
VHLMEHGWEQTMGQTLAHPMAPAWEYRLEGTRAQPLGNALESRMESLMEPRLACTSASDLELPLGTLMVLHWA